MSHGLDRVTALIPSTIPAEETLSGLVGVDDPALTRLLGLASEHVSHLREIGHSLLAECIPRT